MADIRCRNCGEPWDIDTIHEVAQENGSDFDTVRKAFRSKGCVALGGRNCATDDGPKPLAASLSGALLDLYGDDIDGVAADLEDAEWLGLL